LADMGTGITDVIGGPHDFLPPRSDEFQKLWCKRYTLLHWKGKCTECIVIDSVISHAKKE
jgi:hypothetical protein